MLLILLAGLVLLAVGVTLVIRAGTFERARAAENLGQIGQYGYTSTTAEEASSSGPLTDVIDRIAGRLGDIFAPRSRTKDDQQRQDLLLSAGYYRTSVGKFTGYRILSAFMAFAVWLWLAPGTLATLVVAFGFVASPILGWMAPLWYVRTRARRRLDSVDYDLPELIDLLVVTVEAGVGFVASLKIASERLGGALGDELRLVLQEQSLGLTINESLKHMLGRCDTPAVRSFVRSMLQGETLGVSIGQIMRNLATEMRKRRRAAAEERAQKAPIKILFPLVFLIFPSMFVVLLGPAVYSFTKAIGG